MDRKVLGGADPQSYEGPVGDCRDWGRIDTEAAAIADALQKEASG
jgi:hypothetical protein